MCGFCGGDGKTDGMRESAAGRSSRSGWEAKCRYCGLCCHEKALFGRQLVIDLDSWCEYFDPVTKSCRIYHERFAQSNRCRKVSVWKAMFASYLPPDCGYVQWARALHIRMAFPRRLRLIHSKGAREGDHSAVPFDSYLQDAAGECVANGDCRDGLSAEDFDLIAEVFRAHHANGREGD
ncbi:MAG: hypothetical protein ACOX6K_06525 [Sphaerochaetaceae bacterium]|jgi:uncharacterized cysteine cluster protein YcgN (CxxCxxCC family)